MSEYKIFEADGMFWVLTTTPEKALNICIDNDYIDDDVTVEVFIKECDYGDRTLQPKEVVKNIFTKEELEEIERTITCSAIGLGFELLVKKDGTKYCFKYNGEYVGVRLTFGEILNTPKIFSEFEKDSIIASTEW